MAKKKAKTHIKPHMIPSPIVQARIDMQAQEQMVARAKAEGKQLDTIIHGHDWKRLVRPNPEGYFELQTDDTGDVPVRLFFTQKLLDEAEDILYTQIVNATRFPGVKLVVITPDAHFGYGVPVGSVILTDGTLAMGPVGYDIGCFTGDTLVPTVDGKSYPIADLVAREEELLVYALDTNRKTVVAHASARKTREAAPLVKVTLDNGREVICTPDHQFMLRNGSYLQAQDLQPGASLMPFRSRVDRDGYDGVISGGGFGIHNHRRYKHGYNHKVVSVETLDRREDVYCLTVPGYGNFALDAGVFVHNCGMVSAKSNVPAEAATPDRRLAFNRAVMQRIEMGAGGKSKTTLRSLSQDEFVRIVKGGADYYISRYGAPFDRGRAERNRIPVDEEWQIPWGGKGRPERGIPQLGSLGGGKMVASHLQQCRC